MSKSMCFVWRFPNPIYSSSSLLNFSLMSAWLLPCWRLTSLPTESFSGIKTPTSLSIMILSIFSLTSSFFPFLTSAILFITAYITFNKADFPVPFSPKIILIWGEKLTSNELNAIKFCISILSIFKFVISQLHLITMPFYNHQYNTFHIRNKQIFIWPAILSM